jgi:hypothetical protein
MSCEGSGNKNAEMIGIDSVEAKTERTWTASVLPGKVDSFDILYYKKPFSDSTRYTRYFRVIHTSDSTLVSELNKIFNGNFVKLMEVKKCLSEGKIILPIGGDAFRVVYFSRIDTDCSYLYYIKDGEFYYYEMSSLLKEKLNAFEKVAVEPR